MFWPVEQSNRPPTLYCLIGLPVNHSLSPLMQNEAFKELKMNRVYLAFNIERIMLRKVVEGLRGLGVGGFNVTIPYKEEIMRYLDDLDESAQQMKAVNTVLNRNGELIGFNTDVEGVEATFRKRKIKVKNKRAVVLGAGGAAKAVIYFLIKENVEKIIVLNRTVERAKELIKFFNKLKGGETVLEAEKLNMNSLKKAIPKSDLIVNATPVGMYPNTEESLIPKNLFQPYHTVFDVIYNPLKTKTLHLAEEKGAEVINGLDMLVGQGAASFKIWTGKKPPLKKMKEAVVKTLEKGFER